MTIDELYKKWNSISPYSQGFLLISDNHHPLAFHIGYQGECRCFIILDTGKLEKVPSSKAITASCIKTAEQKYALQFILNYNSLEELFVKLCWDLIDYSQKTKKPIDAVLYRYNSWMKLLQKQGDGILSPSAQKGLLGELLYLKENIQIFGDEAALTAWVGPEGSDQDYVFADFWSEIKAVSIAAEYVTITSLQQLDRNDKGFLVVYFLDKTSSKGLQTISLSKIISEIRSLISDQQTSDLFNTKLAMYGYYFKDEEKYNENRYRYTEKCVFSVNSEFPKLIKSNVPVGIYNATYKIELSIIDKFKV